MDIALKADRRLDARPALIEGYASLFGVEDLTGDIVRAGAFRFATSGAKMPAMLLQHRIGAVVGEWTRLAQDGRGLYVRGLINSPGAKGLVRAGLDGLSIGFRPLMWQRRRGGGRELTDVELVEVSLVAEPMQPAARFNVLSLAG